MSIIALLLFCADIATTRGSFLVDGWRVWNNATITNGARVVTEAVPVRITLSTKQTLWIGEHSAIRLYEDKLQLEKGCASLDSAGSRRFEAKSMAGLLAGSDRTELARAQDIPGRAKTLSELRPMSQRP